MIPYRPPPVLVHRPLRLTVNERVDKEGSVRSPLDEAKVRVAGSGLDRAPREHHSAESIHCGGER